MSTCVCLFLGRGSERAIVRISDLQRRPGRLCRETLCLELGPVSRGRGSNKSFTRQNSQKALWWVITTKKHDIYLKVHSDFLVPVDLDLILTPTGVEACNCLLTSAVTVVCLHSARRLYLVCGMWAASQLVPAFQWENCLFGHFIFPLDCLVAHMPIHHSRLCCWLRLRCYVVSVVCILYMLYCLICLFCLDVLRCLCFLKRLELWKRYIKQTCCCYNKQVMWSQHGGGHHFKVLLI